MKLIECVPNFSEGINLEIIKKITNEIELIDGVKLLDVDPGRDTNRTVVTFVGTPDMVIEAAFNAIKKASTLIDMRNHKGEHPRMGATDVCPIIPISGISIDECIEYSKILAKRVGNELKIPVFLYEESSTSPDRKNLANIRKGEYEGMEEKLLSPNWKPDFGPNLINKKAGVTAIGVRNYLIAYNINLNTKEKKLATDIALDVREAGRAKRDSSGKILRYKDGTIKKKPGILKYTKAVGWFIDEYKKAQVSMNLTNYIETPIHIAFEEVRKQARERGLRVTGSEIVGLVPEKSLIDAGIYYLKKQKKSTAIPNKEIIHIAIESLGLNDISPFDQTESIIENRISSSNNKLKDLNVHSFINEVSIDSPAPGGGSVSALAGALSSALVSMVSNLSHSKKGYEQYNSDFEEIGCAAQSIKRRLIDLIDKDTEAFNMIMEAFKLSKKDALYRNERIQKATKNAIEIPLDVMKLSLESLKISKKISKIGNKNSLSDSGVASEIALSSINGAYMNVLINLKDIEDSNYKKNIIKRADLIISQSQREIELSRKYVYKKLS